MKIYCICIVFVLVNNCYSVPVQDNEKICKNENIQNQITNDFIIYGMKKPVEPFIGRKSELLELQAGQSGDKTIIITGTRGVGKSELARKYAQEFIEEDKKSSIIWIDAESHETLISEFKNLASFISVDINGKTASEIIEKVFAYFLNKRGLFIFDNAERDNYVLNNLEKFVIGRSIDLHFLITTRNSKWNKNKFKILNLNAFTKEEGEDFLKQNLENISQEEAEQLSKLLKYIPLALSKAAKYIADKNLKEKYTINEFIKEYLETEKSSQTSPESDLIREQKITQEYLLNQKSSDIYSDLNLRPTESVYVTSIRPPTSQEIKEVVIDKVERELSKIPGTISREASRIGQQISHAGKSAGRNIRRFFQRLKNDVSS